MNRQELLTELITVVGATTVEQQARMNTILNDIVLGIQLLSPFEVLITEMTASNILDLKREAIRRYRYG